MYYERKRLCELWILPFSSGKGKILDSSSMWGRKVTYLFFSHLTRQCRDQLVTSLNKDDLFILMFIYVKYMYVSHSLASHAVVLRGVAITLLPFSSLEPAILLDSGLWGRERPPPHMIRLPRKRQRERLAIVRFMCPCTEHRKSGDNSG